MMEAMRPSSRMKSTLFSAISPPNRLVTPRASRSAVTSGLRRLLELARAAPRGQDALRPEDHHEHEDEAEDHALVLGRLELGGQVGEVVAEDHGARVAELVDPEGKALEDLEVQNGDDGGAEDRAGNGAHAAQDDHGEHADGLHEGEGLRVDEDLLGREEHADRPREGGAAGEGHELHAHERHAHGLRGRLVLADRLPGPADVRVLQPPVDEHGDANDEQHDGVEVEGVDHVGARVDAECLQERGEEDGRSPDGRDALGTVGDVDGLVEIVGEHPDDLAEAEGHEGQVVTVEPQHGQAQENARSRGHADADEEEDEEPPRRQREDASAEDLIGLRRPEYRPGVGPDREEGDIAQIQEPGQPHHDVETEGEGHEDADLDGDLHVVGVDGPEHGHEHAKGDGGQEGLGPARDPREVEDQDRGLEEHEEHDRARRAGHAPGGEGEQPDHEARRGHGLLQEPLDHARSRTTSPRRPLGRKIRMRMRMENARMSLYSAPKAPPVSSERYEAAKASRTPSTSPPSMAPGMLPMPPSTAAVKALSPGMKPVYGLIRLYCTPKSTPAPPPMAPPMRKVREMMRLTLMPMSEAADWSSATARMALPILVLLTSE